MPVDEEHWELIAPEPDIRQRPVIHRRQHAYPDGLIYRFGTTLDDVPDIPRHITEGTTQSMNLFGLGLAL